MYRISSASYYQASAGHSHDTPHLDGVNRLSCLGQRNPTALVIIPFMLTNRSDRAELARLLHQVERDLDAQSHLRTPWNASGTTIPTQQEEAAINAQMVRQMELRRQVLPEQRDASGSKKAPVVKERRRTCAFCGQRGDHRTPAQCLSALER
jgi:hypothetical protein